MDIIHKDLQSQEICQEGSLVKAKKAPVSMAEDHQTDPMA